MGLNIMTRAEITSQVLKRPAAQGPSWTVLTLASPGLTWPHSAVVVIGHLGGSADGGRRRLVVCAWDAVERVSMEAERPLDP